MSKYRRRITFKTNFIANGGEYEMTFSKRAAAYLKVGSRAKKSTLTNEERIFSKKRNDTHKFDSWGLRETARNTK